MSVILQYKFNSHNSECDISILAYVWYKNCENNDSVTYPSIVTNCYIFVDPFLFLESDIRLQGQPQSKVTCSSPTETHSAMLKFVNYGLV